MPSRPVAATSPGGIRPTHSPTTFITDLGNAYRLSGRKLPIMDSFAIHPYQDNSSTPPGFAHPNNTTIAIADYDKLVKLLGQAFDGTPQPGSTLPIFYGEFGVETVIPSAKSTHVHGQRRSSSVRAGRQRDAGGVLPRGAGHGVLPAQRQDIPLLPRRRRVEPRSLAVGPVLRGRHPEAEPDCGRGRLARHARRRDCEVRRPCPVAGGEGRPIRRASRWRRCRSRFASSATSTATTASGSSATRAARRLFRRRGRALAGVSQRP